VRALRQPLDGRPVVRPLGKRVSRQKIHGKWWRNGERIVTRGERPGSNRDTLALDCHTVCVVFTTHFQHIAHQKLSAVAAYVQRIGAVQCVL
jgi:hypothetical protein